MFVNEKQYSFKEKEVMKMAIKYFKELDNKVNT